MRKITLPDVTFAVPDGDGTRAISAGGQLHIIAAVPSRPGESFTIDQIRARLPLVEKLSMLGDGTVILLEESEYAELLSAVERTTWSGVSLEAVALVDAVRDAETVEVEEAKTDSPVDGSAGEVVQ